jgi:hypothetical protein
MERLRAQEPAAPDELILGAVKRMREDGSGKLIAGEGSTPGRYSRATEAFCPSLAQAGT